MWSCIRLILEFGSRVAGRLGPVCVLISWAAVLDVRAEAPVSSGVAATEPVPEFGRLEVVKMVLERAEESLAFHPDDIKPATWWFPSMDRAEMTAFLRSSGLSNSLLAMLDGPGVVNAEPRGVSVVPPKALVLGLSRETRGVVYAKLAEFQENARQRQPYKFLEADIDEWRDSGTLSAHTSDMIRRVTYLKAGMACFSDLQIVSDIPFFERGRLLRVLSRVPTCVVKLNVDRKSDIEAMARYWGAGGRVEEVRSVLKAGSEVEGGSKMDLSRLLPLFARSRLYTFPDPSRRSESQFQDCFWTALNFFNEAPVEFDGDRVETGSWVAAHYVQVNGSPRYGDVIMMMDQGKLAIHACVYLADNLVFTKNGKGAGSPWILMNTDDMMQGYLAHLRPGIRLQVITYRLRGS